jgi:hypothetical protein
MNKFMRLMVFFDLPVDLYVASYFDMSEVDADLTPQIKRDLFNIINYLNAYCLR